jgi:hypothetical protein
MHIQHNDYDKFFKDNFKKFTYIMVGDYKFDTDELAQKYCDSKGLSWCIRHVTDYNEINEHYISFAISEMKLNDSKDIRETVKLMAVDYKLDFSVIKSILDSVVNTIFNSLNVS